MLARHKPAFHFEVERVAMFLENIRDFAMRAVVVTLHRDARLGPDLPGPASDQVRAIDIDVRQLKLTKAAGITVALEGEDVIRGRTCINPETALRETRIIAGIASAFE